MAVLSTRLPTREQTAQAGARPVRVLHILPTLAGGGMELAAVRLIRGSRGARVSPAGEDATNAFPSPVDEQACSRERPVQSPAATERRKSSTGKGTEMILAVVCDSLFLDLAVDP